MIVKRLKIVKNIAYNPRKMNAQFDEARIQMDLYDQYYNMKEIIEKDMSIIELAKSAMEDLGIEPVIEPVEAEQMDRRFLI